MIIFSTLRRWWVGVSLWQGLLLVHALVYATGMGRGSRFFVLLAGVVVVALAVIAFTLAVTPPRLDWLRRRLGPWTGPGLVAGWGVLLVFGSTMRPEWVYAHIGISLAATLTLAFVTLKGTVPLIEQPRRWLVTGLVAVMAITALRVAALSAYPPIQYADEGWGVGWAAEYNDTGVLSNRLTGNPDDRSVVRFYVLLAGWFRLVGAGLWQARLFNFLLGLVVIGFSAWAARNLYSRRTAICTALVLFSSVLLMQAARARHDVGLAVAVAVSLWLYSEALKRDRVWLHGLAGLAIGWGAFGHYNAVALGLAMIIGLYGPRYVVRLRQGQRWPEAAAWFYGVGGLIAGLHVVSIQVWPTYQATGSFLTSDIERPSTLVDVLRAAWDHITILYKFARYEFILIGAALGAALWRRWLIDWSLVLVVVLVQLTLGIFAAWAVEFYHVAAVPFYGLVIGSLFGEGVRRVPSPDAPGQAARASGGWRAVFQVVLAQIMLVSVVSFAAVSLGHTLGEPLRHVLLDRRPVVPPPPEEAAWVLDHIEPGATVVGEHYYYAWLLKYDFLSPYLPAPPGGYGDHYPFEGMTRAEIWDLQAVDVFIVNPALPTGPLLVDLVDDGYFATRGYKEAVLPGGSCLYYQPAAQVGAVAATR